MQALVGALRTLVAALALAFYAGGCCAPASEQTATSSGAAQLERSRALAALNRINTVHIPVRIVVDPSDCPTAWSWANGTICVSRGFIQRTSDDELAAVVAHELGHLCLARERTIVAVRFGFRGNGALAVEEQADEVAVRLLKGCGLAADSLANALAVVRDMPQTTPDVKQALSMRIELLGKSD